MTSRCADEAIATGIGAAIRRTVSRRPGSPRRPPARNRATTPATIVGLDPGGIDLVRGQPLAHRDRPTRASWRPSRRAGRPRPHGRPWAARERGPHLVPAGLAVHEHAVQVEQDGEESAGAVGHPASRGRVRARATLRLGRPSALRSRPADVMRGHAHRLATRGRTGPPVRDSRPVARRGAARSWAAGPDGPGGEPCTSTAACSGGASSSSPWAPCHSRSTRARWTPDVARRAWELWPLILVGIGLGLALQRTRAAAVGGVMVALVFGLMAGGLVAGGVTSGGFAVCGSGGPQGGAGVVGRQPDRHVRAGGTGQPGHGLRGDHHRRPGRQRLGRRLGHGGPGPRTWWRQRRACRCRRATATASPIADTTAHWAVTLPRDPDLRLDVSVNAGSTTARPGRAPRGLARRLRERRRRAARPVGRAVDDERLGLGQRRLDVAEPADPGEHARGVACP